MVERKKRGVLFGILFLFLFSIMGVYADYCEGDYVYDCEFSGDCGYWAEWYYCAQDGYVPIGCSSDAPSGCYENKECIDDYPCSSGGTWYSCSNGYEECDCGLSDLDSCSGTPTEDVCPLSKCDRIGTDDEQYCDGLFKSCSTLTTQSACELKIPYGCTWVEEGAEVCESCSIDSDCLSGNCVQDSEGGGMCVETAGNCAWYWGGEDCEVDNGENFCVREDWQATCEDGVWIDYINCAGECDESTGTCANLSNCETGCVYDEDCEGRCAELMNGTKICIPQEEGCGLLGEPNCSVPDLYTICVGSNLWTCDGRDQWWYNPCEYSCNNDTCIEPVIYWADYMEISLPPTSDNDGERLEISVPYNVKIIAENSGLPEGTIDVEIYEEDSLFDDGIRAGKSALTGDVDANGKVVATWEITQEDIDKAASDDSDEDYEFFFKVNDDKNLESEILNVEVLGYDPCPEITRCEDYSNSVSCGADNCDVAEASILAIDDSIVCGTEYDCDCEWDESTGCHAKWDSEVGGGNTTLMGTCTYYESDSNDTCEDDGFLTYGWYGLWSWDPGYPGPPYEDPNDKQGQCETTGISTIECPALIQLPFFGTYGIVATIALIVLIYFFLNLKKKKVKKRKKKK